MATHTAPQGYHHHSPSVLTIASFETIESIRLWILLELFDIIGNNKSILNQMNRSFNTIATAEKDKLVTTVHLRPEIICVGRFCGYIHYYEGMFYVPNVDGLVCIVKYCCQFKRKVK